MDARLSTPRIELVSSDTGPQLQFTVTDQLTGVAVDLTNAVVTMHFRAVGSTTNLFSRTCAVTAPATNGIAVLAWQSTDLDRAAGDYEGELEVVSADNTRQTVYDTIQFRLREDFA
jgi:hypothetical protein|tara:strand:- start:389 stop:736 length:348 start_codon:yes stop_codon:yes gene_type:complete